MRTAIVVVVIALGALVFAAESSAPADVAKKACDRCSVDSPSEYYREAMGKKPAVLCKREFCTYCHGSGTLIILGSGQAAPGADRAQELVYKARMAARYQAEIVKKLERELDNEKTKLDKAETALKDALEAQAKAK